MFLDLPLSELELELEELDDQLSLLSSRLLLCLPFLLRLPLRDFCSEHSCSFFPFRDSLFVFSSAALFWSGYEGIAWLLKKRQYMYYNKETEKWWNILKWFLINFIIKIFSFLGSPENFTSTLFFNLFFVLFFVKSWWYIDILECQDNKMDI